MELPKRLKDTQSVEAFDKCMRLENTLKNIALRMLEDVKEERKKPTIVQMIRTKMHEDNFYARSRKEVK